MNHWRFLLTLHLLVALGCFLPLAFGDQDVEYHVIKLDGPDVVKSTNCSDENHVFCDVNRTTCVSKDLMCNGVWDCETGADENVTHCGCLPSEFQCNSTLCIDRVRICDGTNDCIDGKDEKDCETYQCPVTHFKCTNHRCIPRDKVCDWVDDCGDNSDEDGHVCDIKPCGHNYFTCDNKECSVETSLCDGIENCKDGSDEDPENCAQHFKCDYELYILNTSRCDGIAQCKLTNADEVDCEECTKPNQFLCNNGECISDVNLCDRFCDCKACEDELNCSVSDLLSCDPSTHFMCINGKCLPYRAMCDGNYDCKEQYGSTDENHCLVPENGSCAFPGDWYKCKNEERCILDKLVCDHIRHCVGGDDEENCRYEQDVCNDDEFRCDNHRCIRLEYRCDGFIDCNDRSDELNCACRANERRCDTGECIPDYKWCNRWPNCLDHSDEKNCDYKNCTANEFGCNNGECIPRELVCYRGIIAGRDGCEDMSHLVDCEHQQCIADQFKCPRSYCIDLSQTCDNHPDCMNFEDEKQNCLIACPYLDEEKPCKCRGNEMFCEGKGYTELSIPEREERISMFHLSGNRYILNTTTFSSRGKSTDGLIDLDLSNNSLTGLPDDMFRYMYKLRVLNLANNSITVLNHKSLYGLRGLTQLFLHGNNLQTIGNGTFYHLRKLTILDLSNQNISHIGLGLFLGLHNLHLLNLSGNSIQSFSFGAFSGLSELLTLDLSNNQLDMIGTNFFFGMPHLKKLYLHGNRIGYIFDGAFTGLHRLELLDISHNRLMATGQHAFEGLPKLQTLLTDEYRFCCVARGVPKCLPEPDEFSSCEDLMSNPVLRISIWLLGLVAACGNMVVVVWRAREVRGRKVHSFLITNLAIGDFLMGVYLLLIASVDAYYRGVYILYDIKWRHSGLCQFAGFISTFSSELSVLTLTVITIDRLICIIFPLKLTRLGVKDAAIAMTLVWIFVFFLSVLPLTSIDYFQNFYSRSGVCLALHVTPARPPGWEYSVIVFLVFNFLSFLIIAASYVWMFSVAKKTRSAVRSPEAKSDAAMARRMTLIVMTDFMCWIPIILLGFISLGGANASNAVYAWIAVFILPLNSAVNPVLYTLSTAPFMRNVHKRASRFRKSFMSSMTVDTRNSFLDDRTLNSYTERKSPSRQVDGVRMKPLRTSIRGNSSYGSNDV